MSNEKGSSILPSEGIDEEVEDTEEDKSQDFRDTVFYRLGYFFVRIFLPFFLAAVSIVIGFWGMNIWGLQFWTCLLVIIGSILFTIAIIALVNYIEDKKDNQQKTTLISNSTILENDSEK